MIENDRSGIGAIKASTFSDTAEDGTDNSSTRADVAIESSNAKRNVRTAVTAGDATDTDNQRRSGNREAG